MAATRRNLALLALMHSASATRISGYSNFYAPFKVCDASTGACTSCDDLRLGSSAEAQLFGLFFNESCLARGTHF